MTSYFAPSPYDWPASKADAPTSFAGTDLFPAVTLTASRAKVKSFGDVMEREDELGTCLVAHFEIFGTLIIFYQSALDEKNYWTVFVDMVNCVKKEQLPTKLGRTVVRQLTANTLEPVWTNDAADTEYRSRRRMPAPVSHVLPKLTFKKVASSSNRSRATRVTSLPAAANDWNMAKVASRKGGSILTAKGAMPANKVVGKKSVVTAKKATATKRAALAKKSVSPKK